jgi:hypothetical protein
VSSVNIFSVRLCNYHHYLKFVHCFQNSVNRIYIYAGLFFCFHLLRPVPVAAQFKARIFLELSNIGIVGSNSAGGLNMCPIFLCCAILCVCTGLAMG